jgi:prepilin-type N-terminal cleavage/methylation domain-containing protein
MIMKNDRYGFTLVEVLTVAIIGSILAVIFLTFIRMHNEALNEGVAKGRMMTQSDQVSSQLARKVRSASFVTAVSGGKQVELYNKTSTPVAAYLINGSILMEGPNVNSLHIMKVGGDTVFVDQGSTFSVSTDSKAVTLNLTYSMLYRNKKYLLPVKKDMYRCRN